MNNVDEIIVQLRKEGKSLRDIAASVGLSHMGVKKRIARIETKQKPFEPPGSGVKIKLSRNLKVTDREAFGAALVDLETLMNRIAGLVRNQDIIVDIKGGWRQGGSKKNV